MSDYENEMKTKVIQQQIEVNKSRIDSAEKKLADGARVFYRVTIPCAILSVLSCNPSLYEQVQAHDMRLVLSITSLIALIAHLADRLIISKKISRLIKNDFRLQKQLIKHVLRGGGNE